MGLYFCPSTYHDCTGLVDSERALHILGLYREVDFYRWLDLTTL